MARQLPLPNTTSELPNPAPQRLGTTSRPNWSLSRPFASSAPLEVLPPPPRAGCSGGVHGDANRICCHSARGLGAVIISWIASSPFALVALCLNLGACPVFLGHELGQAASHAEATGRSTFSRCFANIGTSSRVTVHTVIGGRQVAAVEAPDCVSQCRKTKSLEDPTGASQVLDANNQLTRNLVQRSIQITNRGQLQLPKLEDIDCTRKSQAAFSSVIICPSSLARRTCRWQVGSCLLARENTSLGMRHEDKLANKS